MTSLREGAICAALTFAKYHPLSSCLFAVAILAAVIVGWLPTEMADV